MGDLVQRKQLIKYLPDFMKRFREFQEIMRVEDLQFDRMDLNLQAVLNNAFIADADEYGIRKYETILRIIPSADDTLELRRSRVLLRWNDYAPYTYRVLVSKLNILCGVNNYTITGDPSNYCVHFETKLKLFGQVKELEKLFELILPVNIYYESMNSLECNINEGVILGTDVRCVREITVTNDLKNTFSSDNSAFVAVGTVNVNFIEIESDYRRGV